MPFSDAANPNAFGESDPLVAGIVPLYDDRLEEDLLPQPGSSNPIDQPAFRDLSNLSPDELATVLGVTPVVDGDVSSIEIDADLVETPEPEEVAITDDDLLTNADDEAIATQEDLTQSDFDEEVTVEEDLEETDDEISNTSETEEDAIADDVEVAVEPIPEIEPLPVLELTDSIPGIFTVGSDGIIRIDYNYDHGKFESEVAIVSTAGLENFLPTDDDFSQFNAEVSRRALSHSELGHIVIADATEGARFSSTKWGPNRNSGTYFGVKSFQMNPGDNYMVVMVPNRTFQETLEKSATHSSQRLLFSVSDFNPGEHVQFVQVAAGSADGNLFAFEDLRIDRNSDKSFNDIVLQMRGGEGPAPLLTDVIDTSQGFWLKDMGQALIEYGEPYLTPAPIDLPTVPAPIPDIEVPHDDAGLNTSVTRDDDTTQAGLETTVTRDDEIVTQDSSDAEEETVVVDVPTDTTSAESEEVEDTTSDDETVEASTGFAGVPTISTSPPEPYNFAKQNQPAIVVIDTGFSGNNPDIEYENITSGTDFVTGDNNSFLSPGEGSEHGTHILGIIAATQNNGVGINGVNDDAPIVVIRATGSGRIAEAITEGVDRIQASGQPNGIINLSLDLTQQNPDGSITTRYELTPEEREAIEYARQHGVILAVAAGNQGGVMSVLGQASQEFDNIITVGAAERVNGEMAESEAFDRSDFSSYGRGLDIVAPGGTVENPVLSTVADGVGTMAGTSVATAKVTGAASQIWAANPDLNYRQVIEILTLTSTDLDAPNWDGDTGFGLLNTDAAVKVAKVTAPEDYTPPVSFIPETWGGEGVVTPGERATAYGTIIPRDPDDDDDLPPPILSWEEAVNQEYQQTSYLLGNETSGILQATPSPQGTTGIWFRYETGTIHWTEQYGAVAIWYDLQREYNEHAGSGGWLGFPTRREYDWNGGKRTDFEGGYIYWDGHQAEAYPFDQMPNPGEEIVNGYRIGGNFYPVWKQYQGTLGNPLEDSQNHPSGATYQRFENGSIVSSEHGTFPLYGGIRQEYLNNSGLDGWLGAPTSPEVPQGNGFIKQTFENGYIIWNGSHAVAYESPDAPVQPPPISHPTPISSTSLLGKKISLDPGHGITNLGFDPGASGNGTTEATENLVQANIIAEYLRQRGADVTIIDEPLSLDQIGQRSTGSDAFVALHLNSFNNNAQGHEVYSHPSAPPADSALANAINSELDFTFPDAEIPNRGVKTADFAVLRNAPLSVPAALTEALFIDAPGMSRANVEKAAQAIAQGIEKFLTGSTTDTGNTDGGNSYLDQPLLTQQGVSYFVDRPQFYTTGNIFTQSAYGSNLVDGYSRTEGNCTWYAHGRVKELGGNPAALNSMSGNANEWHTQISNGTQIVFSPQPGDIAQWTSNGQNHVAVVEAVHPNGTMTISESHYNSNWDGGGAGTLHSIRTIGISEPDRYIRVPGV